MAKRIRCLIRACLAAAAVSSAGISLLAADWPMWRYGVARNGASPEALPETLSLQWSRKLSEPKPAWPNESRLHFDASYEPVAVDSQLFVGSMVDGSLAAFDAVTGSENWRFYSDGPVRLAPAVANGRVYFGSDDGFLYCLDADTGTLHWKVSGAPAERGQRMHLGNMRLISFWPVRGGPVVDGGVVYFGAGIWPTMGVFVRAVDADSGRVIWTNGDSHAIENLRIDHNYTHEGGISPQGHLLVTKDWVIVPNGRSMPARLDRTSGELQYFVQGYRNGDSRVTLSDDIALVGATGVLNLTDGREIASRWAAAGKDAPGGWSIDYDLFEGPYHPYKFAPACDYRSAIVAGIAYGVEDGTVFAYDLMGAKTSLYEEEGRGKTLKPARWDVPLKWKLATQFAGQELPTRCVIRAGERIYSHSGTNLMAVSLPKGSEEAASVVWTEELASEPASLLAANGRLFVAATDGTLYCFGESDGKPHSIPLASAPLPEVQDEAAEIAASILEEAGVVEGFAVVLGLSDGCLLEELLKRTELDVIAVGNDSSAVDRLRRRLITDGVYSGRLQLITGDPNSIDLPPYLASLLIVGDVSAVQVDSVDRVKRLFEILRPYGGTACLVHRGSARPDLFSHISPETLPSAKIRSTADLVLLQRHGPLPQSAVWTHETGDASRSFFSRDELVKAPLGVLWYGDGPDHGFYKSNDYGHGIKPQVAGGRMFALQVASDTLHAVDAYTGRLLWTRKVGSSARYVSMPDSLYLADGRECLVVDSASGETRQTFSIDVGRQADVPVSVSDIRVEAAVIVIAVRFNTQFRIEKGRWNSELIVCLDRSTGRQLWSRPATNRYNTAAIAVAANRVFCIDSHSPEKIHAMKRRGISVEGMPSTILAIDVQTGTEVWKKVTNDPPGAISTLHFMPIRVMDDWLEYSVDHDLLVTGKGNHTYALNASTGEEVWHVPINGYQPLILGLDTFINQQGHTYELLTGKLINGEPLFQPGGCNYAVGNKNLVFLRAHCAAYVDVNSRHQFNLRNLRSGCSASLVAADGLLNAPCFSVGCVCNYPIQTSFAMRHMPEVADWHGKNPLRLEPPVAEGIEP